MDSKAKKGKDGNGNGVRPGDRGVYLTCEKHLEDRAAHEVLDVFSRYVEEETTAGESSAASEEAHVDISKAIKAEVAELKKGKSSLFSIKYMSGVHGSGFVVFEPSAPDPTEMVLRVMKDIVEHGQNMFKTCVKILPVSHVCMAAREDMRKLADEIVPLHFPEGEGAEAFQFAVHCEKHCAVDHDLHTMEIIKIFADRVHSRHHVNLAHPAKVILVSVIKNLCCVSVVDGMLYEKYGKFNVRQCMEKRTGEETMEGGVKKVNSESEMRVGVEAI